MSRFKKRFQNRNQMAQELETKNKLEQLEKVRALKQASSMPVFDIICRFDPRSGDFGFSIIGGELSLDDTIQILEKGLDELRMQYIEQKNAQSEDVMENAPDKMKGKSGHKSSPPIVLEQHESEENKKKRLETEDQSADESLNKEVLDDESNGN